MDSGLRQVIYGLSALATSFLAVLLFLLFSLNDPPANARQFEKAQPHSPSLAQPLLSSHSQPLPLSKFRVHTGEARVDSGVLTFSAYAEYGGSYHGLALWSGVVEAAQFPYLGYQLQGHYAPATVSLTWRREDNPTEVFRKELMGDTFGPALAQLSTSPDWRGRIIELGFHVESSYSDNAISVANLILEPWSLQLEFEALTSQWTNFRGWTHRSLNYLRAYPGDVGLSPLPYFAAWSVLAALLLFAAGWRSGKVTGVAYALVLFVPWIALDLLWQNQLLAQLEMTKHQFQGKTIAQKHLADEDSAIYRYVTRLKEEVLPKKPVRIFIADDSRGHDYARLKTQYYLLPHNIYNFGQGAGRPAMRRGDYILVFADSSDPTFARAQSKLAWSFGRRVRAREIDVDVLARLYRLNDKTLELQRHE